ncbi:putative insertion sequence transposase protein, IS66 family [Roseobacter sp. AzwK-3b]|nr:putative insertion sequence transposase protein, IS66 family [Roseobacter sp. AzwK-3b]
MGEDITETLEVIPRQWKVIQTVREKFTCRSCEKISQPPAPFHAIPRGWAGPSLIAMLVFEKYGQHRPLNRQAERFAREGVELSLSTLADLIGHAAVALQPIHGLIETHVRAGPFRQIALQSPIGNASPRHRSARRLRHGHRAAWPSPAVSGSCSSAACPTPCKYDRLS